MKALVVAATALAILAALPYGYYAHHVALVICGIGAIVTIAHSMVKYRPANPQVWGAFGVAAVLFTTSFSLRVIFPDALLPQPDGHPHITDYIDMTAYVVAIYALHTAGRLRDDSSDPTTVIDSIILAGGASTVVWLLKLLPLMSNETMVASGKRWAVAMTVLAIVMAYTMVRIILTSSQKTVSSQRMGYAATFCVIAEGSTLSPSAEINNVLLTAGALALLFLALSARHPSMAEFTANRQRVRDYRTNSQVSRRRVVLMTACVLVAPAALLYKELSSDLSTLVATCLILSWAVVSMFVMVRVGGLMRIRERAALAENTLAHASARFVASTDTMQTYRAALDSLDTLLGVGTKRLSAVIHRDDQRWAVAMASGNGADEIEKLCISDEDARLLLEDHQPTKTTLARRFAPYADDAEVQVVAVPLATHNREGLLLTFWERPLDAVLTASMLSLASNAALALEAASLAEDLHQRRSEQQFRVLIEASPDLIMVVKPDLTTSFASPSMERLLAGRSSVDFRSLLGLINSEDRAAVVAFLQGSNTGTLEFRIDHDSRTEWYDATVSDLRDDEQVAGWVFNARNVTERKFLEDDLRHRVLHDSLTGIANRVLFRDRLDHALAQRHDEAPLTAVLFVDLDDFKTVNDGLGHDVGDELLKVIAFRFESFLRKGDTAARLGGDEFAILLENYHTTESVMTTANRLLEVMLEPVAFGDRELEVSASVGIAVARSGEELTSEILLRNADVAMYHAKQTGKNRVRLFNEAMHTEAFERLELKNELVHALDREQFHLVYQPIVRLSDQQLIGFEALMRWNHPELGLVQPGTFIPLTEETGLIVPVGAWALRQACAQLADWRERLGRDVFISVNVSPRQLDEDGIVEDVREAIALSGIEPQWLTLEVTESAGLDDADSRNRLAALRALGCNIAADDFGSGFASYAALQQLPFTSVKIDRSLIVGLEDDDSRALEQVRSIIQMGHGLGLLVTAEGIENDKQLTALVGLEADRGQGYGLGRPAAAEDAERFFDVVTVGSAIG